MVLGVVRSVSLRPYLERISSTRNVIISCHYEDIVVCLNEPNGDLAGAQQDLQAVIQSVADDLTREPLTLHCCTIPLLILAPIMTEVDRLSEQYGAVFCVVTTSGDSIPFSDFVTKISSLKSGESSSHNNLLMVSEACRFAEMRMDHNWRYEDASGQMRSFPQFISGLLNEKFYPFRDGKVSFFLDAIRYTVDFSRMIVFQEGSDKFGKIDNEPPLWRYTDDCSSIGVSSPQFSRTLDVVTSQEIDLAVHYGAPGLLNLGESRKVSFDVFANPVILHDVTSGLRWYLRRNPPLLESRHCTLTLEVRCRRSDWPRVELALNELLGHQLATQKYSIPPGTPPSLGCLLVNIARQFCVKLRLVRDLESGERPSSYLELEGEKEYIFAVKFHLLEVFQQKIAPLAIEKPLPVPPFWKQGQKSTVETVPVPGGTEEWIKVNSLLRKSLPSVQVIEITRVQNLMLWRRYCFFKSLMSRKNGSDQVNEKLLFHGTRSTNPLQIVTSEKGFDFRYSTEDCLWGKGMYFAVRASYCDTRFVYNTPQGTKQVFLGLVLTGKSVFLSKPNRGLKAPPKLPSSRSQGDLYDSVNSFVKNPLHSEIYVIYDHDKAYPAYLITYT